MREKTTSIKHVNTSDGLSASSLKLIALFCMIIDHTGVGIVKLMPGISDPNSIIYLIYWIMRLIGRISFPIYCFFIIEGIKHTRNVSHYALRMLIFGILSEIPFDLAIYGKVFSYEHQNVYWTLFLDVVLIAHFEYIRYSDYSSLSSSIKRILKICGVIIPATYFSYLSIYYLYKYSTIALNKRLLYGIAFIVLLYILYNSISRYALIYGHEKGIKLCINLLLLSVTMFLSNIGRTDYKDAGILTITFMYLFYGNIFAQMTSGCTILTALSNPTEMTSFITIPLLQKYNGKRGNNLKYLFYLAYPLHLIIIYFISVILKLR